MFIFFTPMGKKIKMEDVFLLHEKKKKQLKKREQKKQVIA